MNVQLFFFVLIDLSFEKNAPEICRISKKNASYLQMIGMFWSMLQSENEKISFLYSVWLKKRDYFKNIKLWIFFFTTKMHWKSSKKKQKKIEDSGVGFCNRRGGHKERKNNFKLGHFSSFFFFLHTYTVITV